MGPLAVAGISAGAGVLSGMLGNDASAEQAAKNRRFQKKMYRHRYQYTVEDMRKAGLNPALAYQQGAGAAPSGSMASQDSPVGDLAGNITKGISSALAVQTTKAQIENISAQTAKVNADRQVSEATAANIRANIDWNAKYREAAFQPMIDLLIARGELTGAQREGIMTQMNWTNTQAMYFERMIPTMVAQAKTELKVSEEQAKQIAAQLVLLKLQRAPAEAVSDFAETYWGHNISPALGDASAVVRGVKELMGLWMKMPEAPIGGGTSMTVPGVPRGRGVPYSPKYQDRSVGRVW